MKTASKILLMLIMIIGCVLIAISMAEWIWSWNIPEWAKVMLISS